MYVPGLTHKFDCHLSSPSYGPSKPASLLTAAGLNHWVVQLCSYVGRWCMTLFLCSQECAEDFQESSSRNLPFLIVYDTSWYFRMVSSHLKYFVTLMKTVTMPILLISVGIFFLICSGCVRGKSVPPKLLFPIKNFSSEEVKLEFVIQAIARVHPS